MWKSTGEVLHFGEFMLRLALQLIAFYLFMYSICRGEGSAVVCAQRELLFKSPQTSCEPTKSQGYVIKFKVMICIIKI